MSFHAGQTFTYGETPSATKWNYLWENDYALADGTGISDDAIIARHLADGSVTPAALLAGAGSSWAWQSYTPTLANVTLGTGGTVTGKKCQIGKTLFFEGVITLGTGGSMGSQPTITFGDTAVAVVTYRPLGTAIFEDVGSDVWVGVLLQASTTTAEIRVLQNGNSSDVSIHPKAVTSTNPFTFGNTDRIVWRGSVELA